MQAGPPFRPIGGEALASVGIEGQEVALGTSPVSVAEYRTFVEAGGYDDSDLWTDEGWLHRLQGQWESPRWWFDPQGTPEGGWEAYLVGNHPVVGISWFEADAYTRWAKVRLPTEAEWLAAAQGADGRRYPWGNEIPEGRTANRGRGPAHTYPVEDFPLGAGPFGHMGLAGSVWQWTATEWPEDDRIHYVVKGGSWASHDHQCENRHRNAYAPEGRWSHVGFRVVRT